MAFLDASIIPFPVSAHLVRFFFACCCLDPKYFRVGIPNSHFLLFLSDVYGLRGRRTSKFLFFYIHYRIYHGLAYLHILSFFEKKAVDFIKEDCL